MITKIPKETFKLPSKNTLSEKPTKKTEETAELPTKPSPSKKHKFEEPAEKQINYKGA